MTPDEKIQYVKKQIRERAQISPKGPIHLQFYTLTEYEDGPTLISVGEQGTVLRKLESEGYIKHLKFDEDKYGAWLEVALPPKPRIKLKVLELITKKLADVFTTQEIVSALVDFGIHREDIPVASKWRMIFGVAENYLSSSLPSSQQRGYDLIAAFLHPLNFNPDANTDNQYSERIAEDLNKFLRYDGLKIVPIKYGEGYEVVPITTPEIDTHAHNKPTYQQGEVKAAPVESGGPHDQMRVPEMHTPDYGTDAKEQVEYETSILRSRRGAELMAIVRKAYLTLMNIAEVFSADPSKPTRELNANYVELATVVEKTLEGFTGDTSKFDVFGFGDFKKINYGLPFANLYSAEHDFKRVEQMLSWDNIRPAMNAVLGHIEVLCEAASAGDVIADPKIQKLIGDTQLLLSQIVAERKKKAGTQAEPVLKVELTKIPEFQVRSIDDVPIVKGKRRVHLPKFKATDWAKVTIRFIDEQNVVITADKKQVPSDYEALGFADEKRGKPNTAWAFLLGLARSGGATQTLPKPIPDSIKQQKKQLSDLLKAIFKNDTDPFYDPADTGAYRAKITLIPPTDGDEDRDTLGTREYLKDTMTEVYEGE